MEQRKLDWCNVKSSNVDAVAYHHPTGTLCVKFRSGGLYSYSNVHPTDFTNLVGADSVGRYMNNVIKALYEYQRFEVEDDLLRSLSI